MQMTQPNIQGRTPSPEDIRTVAPALEAYTQERLYGDVWKRPGLTPRDRSLITIAALIARDQAPALTYYLNQAIENGVKPREISENHHAPGVLRWLGECAQRAVGAAKDVFAQRGIGAGQLPPASVQLLPARRGRGDRTREAGRRAVRQAVGTRGRAIHHGRAVSRSLATSGSGASRPESRHRERPDRDRTGRAAALSLEQGDGLRTDAAAGPPRS